MKKPTFQRILRLISHSIVLFLLVAFVVTCCMTLFLTTLSATMDLTLTEENLSDAAKLTFGNVVLLTALLSLIDFFRRKWMVDRPVKIIMDAARKIMDGDYSVRIGHIRGLPEGDGFLQIADCFNKMAQELSGTETLRTDFIANVSHELKTPLAVMGNYASLLQRPGLSQEQRMEYAKAISDSSRNLAQLITNILKLNKLENQQIYPHNTEFDLGEQLCTCLLAFEDLWERKNIRIETDLEEEITLRSDPELLSLVWNNLFSNALKFTPDGGTVRVELKSEGDWVRVSVADTGCGIRPEVGVHIFEKFYQGDTSHSAQGNGLGLALVKRVMDILGGEIGVESVYGQGSTFTVRIRRK